MTKKKAIVPYIREDFNKPIAVIGRKTTYTSRTIPKARAYINKCLKEIKTPFIEELALHMGVSSRTLYNWAYGDKTHVAKPGFQEVYEILKTVQKLDIKKKALLGQYENPIAKLILSAEHNVVERVRKEVTGEGGGPVKVEEVLSPEKRRIYAEGITKIFEQING